MSTLRCACTQSPSVSRVPAPARNRLPCPVSRTPRCSSSTILTRPSPAPPPLNLSTLTTVARPPCPSPRAGVLSSDRRSNWTVGATPGAAHPHPRELPHLTRAQTCALACLGSRLEHACLALPMSRVQVFRPQGFPRRRCAGRADDAGAPMGRTHVARAYAFMPKADLTMATANSEEIAFLTLTFGGSHQPPAFISEQATRMRLSSSS